MVTKYQHHCPVRHQVLRRRVDYAPGNRRGRRHSRADQRPAATHRGNNFTVRLGQRRLLEVSERLLSNMDPSGVFELIADSLKAVLSYDNLTIYRVWLATDSQN